MKTESGGSDIKDDLKTGEWSQIFSQLLEKLTSKDLSTTYSFQDLEIDVPKATGPDGRELGSAKWTINGKIIISSRVKEKGNFPE